MNEVRYKQKDGTFLESFNKQVPDHFTGYKIIKDYNKISSISEYNKGQEIGIIGFRPTRNPVIFSVKYGGYNDTRYNNGSVCSTCHWDYNGKLNGEYRKLTIQGDIHTIKYFHNSIDVTEDIKTYIGFNDNIDSFKNYKFTEEEIFSLYMMYGSLFKFYNEYRINSSFFDDIVKFCLK